jgi:hypothetical protein
VSGEQVGQSVENDALDRARAEGRAEALEVAALLLGKVRDYWAGRPVEHHGHHIYADMLDVLRGIEADARHNRTRVTSLASTQGAER